MIASKKAAVAATAFLAIFGASAIPAAAQTQPGGPMFSTPAQRSTTGAPILSNPSTGSNGVIGSAGGGRAGAAAPSAQAQSGNQAAQRGHRTDEFGDWELQCEGPAATELCQVTTQTTSADAKQVILVASLAPSRDRKTMLVQMAVPLGVAVQQKVLISFEGGYTADFSINRCTQQGCLIEGPVAGPLLEAMKSKAKAEIVVATPDGKSIPIQLSLNGFSNALAALEAKTALRN